MKLNIPVGASESVPLERSMRFVPQQRSAKEREALMFVVLICTTLWGLFWFQFVTSIIWGLPAFYTLSGGNWFYPEEESFIPNSGPFPWSLAGTFVFISFFVACLGLVGACLWTHGVVGKWRMRLAVLIFSTILCGWAIAGLRAESGVVEGIEKRIEIAKEQWKEAAISGEDEWTLKYYRTEVERLEELLEESR